MKATSKVILNCAEIEISSAQLAGGESEFKYLRLTATNLRFTLGSSILTVYDIHVSTSTTKLKNPNSPKPFSFAISIWDPTAKLKLHHTLHTSISDLMSIMSVVVYTSV